MRESRLNPFNWFGRGEPRETVQTATPQDPRLLVEQVLSLSVDPYSSGAIVRAKGVTPTQGWWDAELVARPVDENGTLVLDFRIFPPVENTPQGAPQTPAPPSPTATVAPPLVAASPAASPAPSVVVNATPASGPTG